MAKLATMTAGLASLTCAADAAAHHSFAAHFTMDAFAEIEGQVTDVDWVNPHVKIYVRTAAGETWEVEAGPLNLLSRMGIERDMIELGETIRVRGNPGRRNAHTLWVANILLPDNTELLAAPGAQPYWRNTAVGDASAFFEAGELAPPADGERSFFRIWTPLITAMPRPRGAPALTAEGQRRQARYETGEQAVGDCEVPGMPFAMMSPYPIEIVDAGDRILIRGEAYDLERVVYRQPPAPLPEPSPLGLSVGRFAGDELIVETSRIDYHSFGDLGPAQSDRSHVVERFRLSPDGLALDYDITVTDSVILAEPWSWGGSFIYRAGAELKKWNCGVE
jgi:hypothetical protein